MNNKPHPIKRARQERGLSRKALADQIGVNAITVWRWETGHRFPERKHWPALERLTGLSISEINQAAA